VGEERCFATNGRYVPVDDRARTREVRLVGFCRLFRLGRWRWCRRCRWSLGTQRDLSRYDNGCEQDGTACGPPTRLLKQGKALPEATNTH
jgi:hypothetical protein